jgi:citrate synthase
MAHDQPPGWVFGFVLPHLARHLDGVCGAALAYLGLPVELLRGFALLARAAGLLGQIAEERRRPIGRDAYLTIDRNAVYVDPSVTAD